MVFKFDDVLIYTVDMPTVRMVNYLQEFSYDLFLKDAIIEWSLSEPLTLLNINRMRWEYASRIVLALSSIVDEINRDIDAISSLIRSMIVFKGRPNYFSPVYLKYNTRFRVCFPCVDNEANLVVLPSGTSVETMRYDDMVIIEAVITAKAEAIERMQQKHRR